MNEPFLLLMATTCLNLKLLLRSFDSRLGRMKYFLR